MNKYGQSAIRAVELINLQEASDPIIAWDIATSEIFGHGSPAQTKGCPRNTFLSVCETGYIKGIKSGMYTTSKKNKEYALRAIELLKLDAAYSEDPELLWYKIMNGNKKVHNSQMYVVVALYNEELLYFSEIK